ncbi:MAG: hypothetical protein QOI21_5078 [Actinomycetota bacterium]|jgi:hypothetical protein|nr:hypothetical protein [Actinomycetota bacterium]
MTEIEWSRQAPVASTRYESYSHEAMVAEVNAGNDPAAAGEIGAQWADLAGKLEESTQALTGLTTRSEESWQGGAGDAMRGVLAKAAGWLDKVSAVSAGVGDSVSRQAEVAARAKDEMPPPVPYDPARMIRSAAGGGDIRWLVGLSEAMAARRAESEAARIKAVDVMYVRDTALHALAAKETFGAPPALGAS